MSDFNHNKNIAKEYARRTSIFRNHETQTFIFKRFRLLSESFVQDGRHRQK